MRAALAGYGFLGKRIAARLSAAGYRVSAVRRSATVNASGIIPIRVDLTLVRPVFTEKNFSAAVFCLAPGTRDEANYKQTYCDAQENFLAGLNADRYVFISSTAVYPDQAGNYKEDSAIAHSARAGILLSAERIAMQHPAACVLRLAGLYSRERPIYHAGRLNYPEDKLVHFLHVEDAARSVVHALQQHLTGIYNVHDGNPLRRSEIFARLGFATPILEKRFPRILEKDKFFRSGFTPIYSDYFTGIGDA